MADREGIWADATVLQLADLHRLREMYGVSQMALRLAVVDVLESVASEPVPGERVEAHMQEYMGRAAVKVSGAVPNVSEEEAHARP